MQQDRIIVESTNTRSPVKEQIIDEESYVNEIPEGINGRVRKPYIAYLKKPTITTARALVKSIGIFIPFENEESENVTPTKRTVSQRGGKKKRGGATIPIKAFAITDMLHDISSSSYMTKYPTTWENVRKWSIEYCQPDLTTSGITTANLNKGIIESWMKSVQFPEQQLSNSMEDIHDTIAQWASKSKLSIFFDGILEENFYSIVETALFLLLIHGGLKIEKPRLQITGTRIISKIKEIEIFDGYFQMFDMESYKDYKNFLQNYVNELKKRSGADYIKIIQIGPISPKYLIGYSILQIPNKEPEIILPDGSKIEYQPSNPWYYRMNPKQQTHARIHLPYKKYRLQDIVQEYFQNSTILSKKQVTYFERVAYLNFFRDSYKADIALQKDAILWTHDRLLFVFSILLAYQNKETVSLNRTIFLPADTNNNEHFMVYRDESS